MKNKKFYIKKNILSFIIGTFIFGIINVYAITYYPSLSTTYDHSASGMQSTNVQDAIDELYNVCKTKPAGEQIIEDNNLQQDQYECRYFFQGANPNNYITFNDENAGWRIISVECDGTIKIMRINSIGQSLFDAEGANDWPNTTIASSLDEYLNWRVNITALQQLVKHEFPTVGWSGMIGTVSVPEYVQTNSNVEQCGDPAQYNDNYMSCNRTGWMDSMSPWWSMDADTNNSAFFFGYDGISSTYSTESHGVRFGVKPAVYLSSKIEITGGDGSKSNPYTIK